MTHLPSGWGGRNGKEHNHWLRDQTQIPFLPSRRTRAQSNTMSLTFSFSTFLKIQPHAGALVSTHRSCCSPVDTGSATSWDLLCRLSPALSCGPWGCQKAGRCLPSTPQGPVCTRCSVHAPCAWEKTANWLQMRSIVG